MAELSVRDALAQIFATIEPPPEIAESEEFLALQDLLFPQRRSHEQARTTGFEKESKISGKMRLDILNRQVGEAVRKAMQRVAQKRVDSARQAEADNIALTNAAMNLQVRVRELAKKQRKRKKQAAGDPDAVEEPLITTEEAEELMQLGLEAMQVLREEIAPDWAPDMQPWFLQNADSEVYSILLSVIPEELFQQTQAYQGMQDLRKGEQVFRPRAELAIEDALSGGGSTTGGGPVA